MLLDSKTSIRKLLGAECKPPAADYVEVVNRSLSAHGSISAVHQMWCTTVAKEREEVENAFEKVDRAVQALTDVD